MLAVGVLIASQYAARLEGGEASGYGKWLKCEEIWVEKVGSVRLHVVFFEEGRAAEVPRLSSLGIRLLTINDIAFLSISFWR